MSEQHATARSCSNIAFIKYWGNANEELRLPLSPSLSMNLSEVHTTTTVRYSSQLSADRLIINGDIASEEQTNRTSQVLDFIRKLSNLSLKAEIVSENNFPTGAGIASSASAFSALAVAATAAADLSLNERELSTIARLGSGSACRSIPSGFVEWHTGSSHETSYATSIAPPEYWDLVDLIAIIDSSHKKTGSSQGHAISSTSPFQIARINDAERRLEICREAIFSRDFDTFSQIIEEDTLMMHAVMMTSKPPLFYWLPGTMGIISIVQDLRERGLPAAFTIDAGANVHVMTTSAHAEEIRSVLQKERCLQSIIEATPGIGAHLVDASRG